MEPIITIKRRKWKLRKPTTAIHRQAMKYKRKVKKISIYKNIENNGNTQMRRHRKELERNKTNGPKQKGLE